MSAQKKAKVPQKRKGKSGIFKRTIWVLIVVGIIKIAWLTFWPIVNTPLGKSKMLYIKSGQTFKDAVLQWELNNDIKSFNILSYAALLDRFNKRIRAGAYEFPSTASQMNILLKLFKGQEQEVNLTLSGIMSYHEILGKIGEKLEPDSANLEELMNNSEFLDSLGLTKDTRLTMFIPDTYRFYWDTDAKTIINKLHAYYLAYWTYERRQKAAKLNLSIQQVSILASIVDGEAIHFDEMPAIAGLYLNRLNKGMQLQADPTVKFALGRRNIRRLTFEDYKIDHPYNTYKIPGLPPGPISMASKQALNATLNPESHDYFFMVARADRSGYHQFTKTFQEHRAHRKQYVNSLNERGVGR